MVDATVTGRRFEMFHRALERFAETNPEAGELYLAIRKPDGALETYHQWPEQPSLPGRIMESLKQFKRDDG